MTPPKLDAVCMSPAEFKVCKLESRVVSGKITNVCKAQVLIRIVLISLLQSNMSTSIFICVPNDTEYHYPYYFRLSGNK